MFFALRGEYLLQKANVFTWRPTARYLHYRTGYRHIHKLYNQFSCINILGSPPFRFTLRFLNAVFGILSKTILNCSSLVHLRILECSLWTSNLRAVLFYAELSFIFYDSRLILIIYTFCLFVVIPMGPLYVNLYFNLHCNQGNLGNEKVTSHVAFL